MDITTAIIDVTKEKIMIPFTTDKLEFIEFKLFVIERISANPFVIDFDNGHPQLGQLNALFDISFPHSGHLIKAIYKSLAS